jgi:hypothetical protein
MSGVGAARWSQMTPVTALCLVDVPWVCTAMRPSYKCSRTQNPQALHTFIYRFIVGVFLSERGRREPALAAREAAVEIYRGVAAANPAAFDPGLAGALTKLAISLGAGPAGAGAGGRRGGGGDLPTPGREQRRCVRGRLGQSLVGPCLGTCDLGAVSWQRP